MAATLRFFGTAAYELVTEDGARVLIDPYLTRTRSPRSKPPTSTRSTCS